ncbi:MAG: hypothetical protein U0L62_01370 [Paludibacteraceae bacterium]|nr:hypothetical protein [Paludibacteraceae bacterium]
MKKQMYNKPEVEIVEVQGGNVMLSVSVNGGGGGGVASAPAKRGVE